MPRKKSEKTIAQEKYKKLRAHDDQKQLKKKLYEEKEWYTCRSLLGNQ